MSEIDDRHLSQPISQIVYEWWTPDNKDLATLTRKLEEREVLVREGAREEVAMVADAEAKKHREMKESAEAYAVECLAGLIRQL